MKRKKIVAANWKMNLIPNEADLLMADIDKQARGFASDVVIIPSFILTAGLMQKWNFTGKYRIGAQNCSQFDSGAYTGEVSAAQLAGAGIEYVIIGHSERREYFQEDNRILVEKVKLALQYKLKPIFCCGEPVYVRNAGGQKEFVGAQIAESIIGFSAEDVSNIVIAYEPIWAIGTGVNATVAQAQEMHEYIRQQVASHYSDDVANRLRVIYGGSCKPSNAPELFSCPDVDGGLIGGASLNASDFVAIVEAADKAS